MLAVQRLWPILLEDMLFWCLCIAVRCLHDAAANALMALSLCHFRSHDQVMEPELDQCAMVTKPPQKRAQRSLFADAVTAVDRLGQRVHSESVSGQSAASGIR